MTEVAMGRDEAVKQARQAAYEDDRGCMSIPDWVSAFHRALRERGFAVVPVEPTRAMKDAALAELSDVTVSAPKAAAWDAIRAYRAMLEAAR